MHKALLMLPLLLLCGCGKQPTEQDLQRAHKAAIIETIKFYENRVADETIWAFEQRTMTNGRTDYVLVHWGNAGLLLDVVHVVTRRDRKSVEVYFAGPEMPFHSDPVSEFYMVLRDGNCISMRVCGDAPKDQLRHLFDGALSLARAKGAKV